MSSNNWTFATMAYLQTRPHFVISMIGLCLLALLTACPGPPPPPPPPPPVKQTVALNVFFESSASMDGYVRGDNEFEAAMMRLFGGIGRAFAQDSDGSISSDGRYRYSFDGINLYTVACDDNQLPIPYIRLPKATVADIDNWFKNVEPATLGAGVNGRKSTELKSVLQLALDSVANGRVSVVISDMILSPSSARQMEIASADVASSKMERILLKEQSSIENTFGDFLKTQKSDVAMLGYRFESRYEGVYYPEAKVSGAKPTAKPAAKAGAAGQVALSSRPYFVWFVGTLNNITHIAQRIELEGLRTNRLTSACVIMEPPIKKMIPNAEVVSPLGLRYPAKYVQRRGQYVRGDEKSIVYVEELDNGQLVFAFDVDLPSLADYTEIDAKVTHSSAGHRDSVVSCQRISAQRYRVFVVSLFPAGSVPSTYTPETAVTFYYRKPTWFDAYNVDDDNLTTTDPEVGKRTFGLRYLMEGVWKAFYPKTSEIGVVKISYQG